MAVFYGWAFVLNEAWALVKNFDTYYGAAPPTAPAALQTEGGRE